jgi:hypothetical protein
MDTHGYLRIPFAQTLKEMARPLFAALGYTPEQIKAFEEGDKTDKIRVGTKNVTVRHIYQQLGTEWGRERISPVLWIVAWQARVAAALDSPKTPGVVVDDLRFPNEAAAVRRLSGRIWFVHRPDAHSEESHASEGQITINNADHVVDNSTTLAELQLRLQHTWGTP